MTTPLGVVPASEISVARSSTLDYMFRFPLQTAPGEYTLKIGPDIQDLPGSTMSQAYTGSFTIALPVVEGAVYDTNGTPIVGVAMEASDSGSPYSTDANGRFSIGVPQGTVLSVTPHLPGWQFVPGTRSYTNVTDSIPGQNFLAVNSLAPTLSFSTQGSGLVLNCFGIPGVAYRLSGSSNLVDWVDLGEWQIGTNGPLGWVVPPGTDPAQFFRLKATN